MRQKKQPVTDRRLWLTGVVRYSTLCGLVIVSGSLVTRHTGRSCPGLTTPCGTCGLLAGCKLPRAQAVRDPRVAKGQG